MWHGITHNDVVVYSLESDHLRNITEGYAKRLSGSMPDGLMVDRLPSRSTSVISFTPGSWVPRGCLPNPASAGCLAAPRFVSVSLRRELVWNWKEMSGGATFGGPRHLMILIDGVVAGDTRIYDPEAVFGVIFPMPDLLAGKKAGRFGNPSGPCGSQGWSGLRIGPGQSSDSSLKD